MEDIVKNTGFVVYEDTFGDLGRHYRAKAVENGA